MYLGGRTEAPTRCWGDTQAISGGTQDVPQYQYIPLFNLILISGLRHRIRILDKFRVSNANQAMIGKSV